MIALIACREYPELGPDDAHLLAALDRARVPWTILPWDADAADWSSFDAAVVRATWDYFRRPDEFGAWIDARRADGSRVWNPPDVLAWNMRKDYLRALAESGVRVADTEWLEPGDDVAAALSRRGWERAVAKPVVSAGGWRTEIVTAGAAVAAVPDDVMLQPFLDQIVEEGEWSFVFFGGAFSHAFVKRPAPGNFLVQERHGGSVHPMEAPRDLLRSAENVLAHVPGDLLYARVDGVRDGAELLLIELEIFEPVLYFGAAEGSAERFMRALLARM